jgi:hypothetical protein
VKPIWKGLLIVGAVVALVVGADRCYGGRADAWEARVKVALAESRELRSRVVGLQAEAEVLRSQAVASAEEAAAREPVIIERIRTLPPAVTPGEVLRDTIIVELQENSDKWKFSYRTEVQSHDLTREALKLALVRGDSLYSLLVVRPTKKPWWIPQLGIGPFAGVCAGGNPCVGPVAINLSWKISL